MTIAFAVQAVAQSGGMSSSVIWGLIGASFVLEVIVFAVCVALVRQNRRRKK